jgi:hypothetical protein
MIMAPAGDGELILWLWQQHPFRHGYVFAALFDLLLLLSGLRTFRPLAI